MTTYKERQIVKERIQILIEDLRNSETTRKQNFSSLAEQKGGKIVTYCALGALGCEKNVIKVVESEFGWKVEHPTEEMILQLYGISPKLKHKVVVSYYYNNGQKTKGIRHITQTSLSSLIINLNDSGHWTFGQIADYLRELMYADVIRPCSKSETRQAEKYLEK